MNHDNNSQPHSKEKIQEVANVITGLDLQLALGEAKELKRSLALELDFARHCRQAQKREFREFMDELWATLLEIQGQFRVDATLLGLIEPQKAGLKGPLEDEEKDINQTLTDWH